MSEGISPDVIDRAERLRKLQQYGNSLSELAAENSNPMTPEEVIARIRAVRANKSERSGCGKGGCPGCSCEKKNG